MYNKSKPCTTTAKTAHERNHAGQVLEKFECQCNVIHKHTRSAGAWLQVAVLQACNVARCLHGEVSQNTLISRKPALCLSGQVLDRAVRAEGMRVACEQSHTELDEC